MNWDIVYDTRNVVYDYGTITRVNHEGQDNVIKIIREDGYVWYIGVEDRDLWTILHNIDNVPADFWPETYTYDNGVWTKLPQPSPLPTGYTENDIYSGYTI